MSLRGCGLLVVNPPFGFDAEAKPKPQNPRSKRLAVTKPARAPTRKSNLAPPTRNSKIGAQTRKVLTKHYRAKHGVR